MVLSPEAYIRPVFGINLKESKYAFSFHYHIVAGLFDPLRSIKEGIRGKSSVPPTRNRPTEEALGNGLEHEQ